MANDSSAVPLLNGEADYDTIVDSPILEYFVIKQEVELDVNFRNKSIDGVSTLFMVFFNDEIEEVVLDAAHCEIDTDNITISDMREVNGEMVPGPPRLASATYDDPYKKLSHPPSWHWRAEHHDLRRHRARKVFHSRKPDVPAENREFDGCTPVYGSLRVSLKGKEQERPKLIIRKSTKNLESTGSPNKQFKISIPFSNKDPRDGVHFVGVDALDTRFPHVYTRHSMQPGTASCIFPCVDDHGSRCDWRISIKYPRTLGDALHQALATQSQTSPQDREVILAEEDKLREMSVVCSGFLVEEKVDPEDDHKKIMTFEPEKKTSVQNLGFAVGPFEHIDLSSECRTEEDELKLGMSALKVHAYCLPGRADWVRNTTDALTMAADFLTYTFARYPFSNFKICFVDDLMTDTVPLHSLAFISNRLLYPQEVIDTEMETTRKIIYTLTYQWMGINMIPNTRNDLWLVIGLASYLTDLFMKKLCGNNEHRFRMKAMSDKLVKVDIERASLWDLGHYLHLGEFEMDFMMLKAPLVLFILDKRLNKISGGHGLQRILSKWLTKAQIEASDRSAILDTEKFRTLCERTSRYRLEAFWAQWIYGSGCPRFDVKAKFNKKRLCVELTLNQIQHQAARETELRKDDFLRQVKERRAEVPRGDVQHLFTGPMTVRIHEADGTPYEHILEIREDAMRSTKFEIPYNTKYKRLKRTRRMKEKHNVGVSMEAAADNAEDTLLYSLGDVLSTPEDQAAWELIDWDPETERKMDQESYEWIRVDTDFEWASDMKRTLEPYMYVSQLQQDRDVVAQQDAILYLTQGPLHPIASGFLVRTLVDRRYFHGIRTLAAEALPRQSNIKDLPMLGLRQLMRAFRDQFCFDAETNQPRPNDFTDKRQYKVKVAIIKSIAEVRDANTHRCPLEGRRFILDQLLFNNNEGNPFSDHYYISTLVKALARSMLPSQQDDWMTKQQKHVSEEERIFLEQAMEQIERVLRRDEWTNSYRNVWTIAGLDAKQRLMKSGVIPKSFGDFGQYLLDGTSDLIRIKCFEALVDLGAMMEPAVFTFLLFVLTTDRSPWVRSQLVNAMASGLAAIAFGEHSKAAPPKVDQSNHMDVDAEGDEVDDPLELIQDTAQEIEARKEKFARKENLDAALKALRREMDETYIEDERHYSAAMRKALDRKGLGRAELETLLDLAAMMFEEAQDWIITLSLPKAWKVERQVLSNRCMMRFKSYYKTAPKVPLAATPVTDLTRPSPLARTGSIKINTNKSARSVLPGSGTPKPSQPVPQSDTIVASSAARQHNQMPKASEPIANSATPKRPRDEEAAVPAPKRPKTEPGSTPTFEGLNVAKKRLLVTLKTNNPTRLAVALGQSAAVNGSQRKALPGSATKETPKESVTAKPRKPLPGGGESTPVRKPLPSSSPPAGTPAGSAPPRPTINTAAANGTRRSPVSTGNPAGSPIQATPLSAKPKIKIVRKPPPPQGAPATPQPSSTKSDATNGGGRDGYSATPP